MRAWLDEMIPSRVARELRRLGYDVEAVQEPQHRWAWALEDADQLEVATRQGRALVSYNIRDFVPLSLQWAEAERVHTGILVIHVHTIAQHDVGALVQSLARFLDAHPTEDALEGRVEFLTRAGI